MFCHESLAGISDDLSGRMQSTVETEAGKQGRKPAEKEGCCWSTCNVQLWCNVPKHEVSLDEFVVLES